MQDLTFDTPRVAIVQTHAFRVSKKLLWLVLTMFVCVFIVLLVLTIHFGVKQQRQTRIINDVLRIITQKANRLRTITSSEINRASSTSKSIARIPDHWQQLSYRLTITPNFTNETFEGKGGFTTRFIAIGTAMRWISL